MKSIFAAEAPAAIGPYTHAVVAGNMVYCSGQTPLDPESGKVVGDNVYEQTQRVIRNIESVLRSAGLTLHHVVKTNVYLTDMEDFTTMNTAYAEAFGTHRPARTTVAVRALPCNAQVEIECIAVKNSETVN